MMGGPRAKSLGLGVLYGVALAIGPVASVMLWITALGLWGGDFLSIDAAPGWAGLVVPELIGLWLGWHLAGMPAGGRWMALIGPVAFIAVAGLLAILGLEFVWGGRAGVVGFAAVYALAPLGLGALLRIATRSMRRPDAHDRL